MKASEWIIERIKEWEGLRLSSYLCPAGVLTIGYGHTGQDVHPDQTITPQQAEQLLRHDIETFERQLSLALWGMKLQQCQWDALLSLAYNIGIGNFKKSTLLKKLRANPHDPTIRDEFLKWNKAGGRVLPGLVKRRLAESKRYFNEQ